MVTPTWPSTLPQFVLRQGYGEGFKDTVVRSATDSGRSKRRQRFINGPQALSTTMVLNDAELAIFNTFFEDELGNGALSFTFPHPRLATTVTVAFTETPEPISPEGATTYFLRFRLEILP